MTWPQNTSGHSVALIGKDSAGSGPGFVLRYAWTGRELDTETGLYFFRSRYYDPGARRFVQEDVAGYGGGSNLYAYGSGNPTNGRDPDGMSKSDLFYSMESSRARTLAFLEASNPLGFTCYVHGVAMSGICGSMAALAGGFGRSRWVSAVPDNWTALVDEIWAFTPPTGDAHIVTVCKSGSCRSATVFLSSDQARVLNEALSDATLPRPPETHIRIGLDRRFRNLPEAVEEKSFGWDIEHRKYFIRFTGVWQLQRYSWPGAHYIMVDGRYEGGKAVGTIYVIPLWFTAWIFGSVQVTW